MTQKFNKIPPVIYLLFFILTGGFGIYWFFAQKQNFSLTTTENHLTLQDIPAVPAGVIKYSGSGDWASIKREFDPVITKKWPKYQLNYILPAIVTPTTATALEMLLAGKIAFVQADRPLNDQEKNLVAQAKISLQEIPIAIDGLAIAVHPSLKIAGLGLQQLQDIYTGKITNWQAVGGPNLPIVPLSPPINTAGTVQFFQKEVLENQAFSDQVKIVFNPTDGIKELANTPGGIYYGSASIFVPQCTIKTLPIGISNSVLITPYQPPFVPLSQCPARRNQVNLSAWADQSYPLTRRFYLIMRNDNSPEAIAGKAYARMLLSEEGQKLIRQAGLLGIKQVSNQ